MTHKHTPGFMKGHTPMTHRHTPGPWMVLSPAIVTTTAGPDWAAHVVADARNLDDAILMSAAPDMLTALEEVTRNVFWDDDKDQAVYQMDGKTMRMVRDAIRKATFYERE